MAREREGRALAYPAHSRRSGGLSVGINLFPDGKRCAFDCPYCEVFRAPDGADSRAGISLGQMESELRGVIAWARERNERVMDVCFSGNGEPTLCADFPEALAVAARVRAEAAPSAKLVLITCGSGLLDPRIFSLLRGAACGPPMLDVWLKLDAGTRDWHGKIIGTAIPHEKLTAKIKEFAALAPATIQTMLCAVDGAPPPPEEDRAWERIMLELAAGGNIRKAQIYGKARPSPSDPKAEALPAEILERRAASLRAALAFLADSRGVSVPQVEVYP